MSRNIYLDNVSVEEAREKWQEALTIKATTEKIDIREATGRRLAKPVRAKLSTPSYYASAMDGIALSATDTVGATERTPVQLQEGKEYQLIDTGDPLPEEFDAVMMIEKVNQIKEGIVEIEESVAPGQNVRSVGESLVKGQLILTVGTKIGPYDIGLVLEGGVTEVTVYTQPQVDIIPTGSELIEPGRSPQPGQIIEYNSEVIKNLVLNWGGKVMQRDITPDKYEEIKEKIQQVTQESDLVAIIAGSSAGREDYTAQIVAELGEVVVHGVSIKPGGPVILGRIGDTPVIGLPGYPVASALNFRLFAQPILYQLAGLSTPETKEVKAILNKKLVSKLGFREFVRAKLVKLDNQIVAVPLARSSGVIGSLVEADGLVTISEYSEGIDKGSEVNVELLVNQSKPAETLMINGSNDHSLDLLKNKLAQQGVDLLTQPTNSLAGLTTLSRGESHLASINLLDSDGQYRQSLDRYFPTEDVKVVNLAYRQQGLIVTAGNPKNITGIADLVVNDLVFINRQQGSGARMLIDNQLAKLNIDSTKISGYQQVKQNDVTLATTIAQGGADVGVGTLVTAQVFDLDFIPLRKERIDLVIPNQYWTDTRIKELFKVICSSDFKAEINQLAGYDTSQTGQVLTDGPTSR
ncbi:molybdenum cofactor synthesis domain protein [Halobacteroides halobius DSM 5150]|uniref:Molybdopterin molybdenumtransferase n=1 Tax=Halobacteroides halobius (strain ATCC 35273 / DSM 5150 / MD-1) TaxID=748449 RepID=L0K9H3_HALHC|nr:molybdopterin biosynthesis protein [Halobacteroides halobius]AGB41190.1 molybdenum cofactor synthesis domain protein [Halobacteroides halobius DSM 5150]